VQASESEEEPIGSGDNNDNQTYDVVGDLEYQSEHAADEEEPLATVCSSFYIIYINSKYSLEPNGPMA
jgi:hypothetical protein